MFEFPSGDPVLDANGTPLVLPTIFISNDDILFLGGAPGLSAAAFAALTFDQDLALTLVPEAERKLDQIQISAERAFRDWAPTASVVKVATSTTFLRYTKVTKATTTGWRWSALKPENP